jgi:alginate O-acetyltransferase complex protein AlgI
MLFNSFEFAVFLIIVFTLYWVSKKSIVTQNVLILVSSYVFYGWWDYRFLFLLIFSTFLDYFTGIRIAKSGTKAWKKRWLFISVFINLGFLGIFKYYNFFATSFADLMIYMGFHPDIFILKIILPVGISFYTFHGLSYVFDIYNDKIRPTENFINYSVFVSFFPLLVAGPIERATHLLPQVEKPRTFDYARAADGMRQMLWGFFKKIVVADNCATIVNKIFGHYSEYSGSMLVIGAVLFAFQIYGDFSGYSDIALGTARLFGFELLRNFSFPYFSRDIAEFWRRWHISLSSWFRDYLYYPLGGSRGSKAMRVRNTFIIFLVSGFWHGANWTFIIWGGLNAIYFLPLLLTDKNRNNLEIVAMGKMFPSAGDTLRIASTFALTVFAWIFFRAKNVTEAISYISQIFSKSLFHKPQFIPYSTFLFIAILVVVEWFQRSRKHGLEIDGIRSLPIRWLIYIAIIIMILGFGLFEESSFIYFQF